MWRWLSTPSKGGDGGRPGSVGPRSSELHDAFLARGITKPQEKTSLYLVTDRIWAFVYGVSLFF